MTENAVLQLLFYFVVLLILVKPLGQYMAWVFAENNNKFTKLEGYIYRLAQIDHQQQMDWRIYAKTMLVFNFLGFLAVYLLQRSQTHLPFNPQHFSPVAADLAFNTAISFVSNTNWQAYAGETTLSYLTQMLALTVQNFLSAATGLAIAIAFIRGLVRRETAYLGNFWVDIVRGTLFILLPLSGILALVLVSQGVIQNLKPYQTITILQPFSYPQALTDSSGQIIKDQQGNSKVINQTVTQQTLPMGPVASQVAIKQLGSNGGGYFNTNSAHPFENSTPLSNFFEMLALILIPAALCYTFGTMVKDKRQGWALLSAMLLIFVPLAWLTINCEQAVNHSLMALGVDQNVHNHFYPAGNMEGKETRFGITDSALWATATTAASNGSVNAMLDSFTPLGGLIPLWLMQLGEVVFGGVGSGLYGILLLVLITAFVSGLMVGRTPEYLSKKIEAREMKLVMFAILLLPLLELGLTMIAVLSPLGKAAIANPGAHGFSEILYAFSSMVNNNGSALAGLNANTPFYNILGATAMFFGRYWMAIPVLAIAGSLATKKTVSSSVGTLATHSGLFVTLLVAVILIIGALTFFPALALGPIVDQLVLLKG